MSSTERANNPTWSSVRESVSIPLPRDQSMCRLETDHTAKRSWTNDRAVGLAAQRERHHVGGHGRGRAAGGTARRVLGVMGISRLTRGKIRKLGCDRLPHDHRSRRAQHCYRGGITRRRAAGVQHRAVFSGHVGSVKDVLNAHRHTVDVAHCIQRRAVSRSACRPCRRCL